MLACVGAPLSAAAAEDVPPAWSAAIGPGVQRLPAWSGARTYRQLPVPYAVFTWSDRVELSTLDGLSVDLVHRKPWHGGVYGDYRRGRSRDELGALAGRINSLTFALYGGAYLEFDATSSLAVGTRLLHDLLRSGTRAEAYVASDLPRLGWLMQSIQLTATAADAAVENRFFGIATPWAARLDVAPYRAGGGWQQIALDYSAFQPTSVHTGIALNLEYAHLVGTAADSPLVRRFGRRAQPSVSVALIYHTSSAHDP